MCRLCQSPSTLKENLVAASLIVFARPVKRTAHLWGDAKSLRAFHLLFHREHVIGDLCRAEANQSNSSCMSFVSGELEASDHDARICRVSIALGARVEPRAHVLFMNPTG